MYAQKLEKEIGYLVEAQKDIRIKNYARTLWESAQKNQSVREGDKVYTGEKSSAIISLKNESRIELKSNSLVEFKKIRNQNIADLSEGQYRVAVSKDIKVSIHGQIAKIEGKSEIILNVDKNKKVSIQTLQGAPKVQYQAKTYTPTVESTVEIEPEIVKNETPVAPQKAPAIQIRKSQQSFNYVLKLYDKYERVGQELKEKPALSTLVNVSIPLPIETYDSSKDISIELSVDAEQSSPMKYDIDPFEHTLPQAFIGENYWRASQQKNNWSEVSRFTVKGVTLPQSALSTKWSSTKLVLQKGAAETVVDLSTKMAANGYLISSSRQEQFDSSAITYWSYQDKIHLLFTRPGLYYYRFRAVDESMQLGQWSDVTTLEVIEPPTLATPQFASQEYKVTAGESLFLTWMTPDPYKNYRVKIYTTAEDKIVERVVTDPFLRWTPKNAGDYYAEVTTLGPYKQVSVPGRASILVKGMEIRLTNDDADKDKGDESEREVASQMVDDTKMQVKAEYPTIHLGYNADFVLSRATFSTNYYDGFNSKSLADNRVLAVATPGAQVSALGWFDHHGGEAIVQKNLSSNEPGSADFYSAEVRYHYRFYGKDEQPGSVGFHLSPFIGYEMFSNSNSTNFLSEYNLMKMGFFMEVPLMQSWAVGLTGGYGSGDSLSKYEAAWDVSYYFKKQWTMGVGVKTNLIFGTNSQFPNYPDYREGYSLGQFNLRYFF